MLLRYFWFMGDDGVSGTPCLFGADTGTSGTPGSYTATLNITGAAGAVVSLKVTTLTNANSSGQLKVNSSQVFLNDTFTITLDGSGNGSFLVDILGDASDTGTVVRGVFSITGVDVGQIGSPSTRQESKVF